MIRQQEHPLKVAVVSHQATSTGGSKVCKNLIDSLSRVAPHHHYLLTIPADLGFEVICQKLTDYQLLVYNRPGYFKRLFDEFFVIPSAVRDFKPDVVLALADMGVLQPGCPQAILVHRAYLCYPPKYYARQTLKERFLTWFHRWHLQKACQHTQILLCQTEVMKRRLQDTYKFEGRIVVCGSAVSALMAEDAGGKQSVPEPVADHPDKFKLVYIAGYYPHKNMEGIVETFDRYREDLSDVIVFTTVDPTKSPRALKYVRSIEDRGLSKNIINLGPVPHDEVSAYYRHCQALLMPSKLESFGLPYVEAMNFGLPILTSDLDFAHAVCGEAALYFDPWNPESMKDAILKLKNSPKLPDELASNCKKRLESMFKSWDEIAADIMKLLAEIASGPSD